ncbi:MAG: hypothetical protein QXG86_03770 [Candidatus Woesearchaeota archaeon]
MKYIVILFLFFGYLYSQSCIECCNQLRCVEKPELVSNKTLWYKQINEWMNRTNMVLENINNLSKINYSVVEKKKYIKQIEYDRTLAFEISKRYYVILGIDIAHAYVLGNIKRSEMIEKYKVNEDLLNKFDKTIKIKYA